ncbi:CHASE domain-containing protein [Candidatus Dojkabacteria bacterium]|uniref:CHASE domain-containing protein n=1 Tax=Candidatus Dojkabacteria bacterium TaxID=2099670 RepID=A0A955L9F9_9BACT|nr:CHASE domain-containing protein [Candidatus Dojkabacteria bacterium]
MDKFLRNIFKLVIYSIPLFVIVLAIFLGYYLRITFNTIARANFDQDTNDYSLIIQDKFNRYERLMSYVSTTFSALSNVDRKTYNDYFNISNLENEYPGVSSISLVKVVPVSEITSFEEKINSDNSLIYNDTISFDVKPINEFSTIGDQSGNSYVVTYIYPFEGREAALGVDLSTEQLRKEAIDKANATNSPIASQIVEFTLQNIKGFHLIAPVKEVDNEETKDFITIAFRLNDFLNALQNDLPERSGLSMEIYDPSGNMSFTNLEDAFDKTSGISNTFHTSLGQKDWIIKTYAKPNYGLDDTLIYAPILVSAVGVAIAVLSGFIIYLLSISNSRARKLAKKLTKNLKITEKRYNDILNNTSALIYLKDLEGNYLFVNKSFLETLDLKYKQLLGRRTIDLFDEEIAKQILVNENKAIESQSEVKTEEKLPTLDNGIVTYTTIKFPLIDETGEVYGVASISTNIEDRKEFEEELTKRNRDLEQLNQLMINRELKMAELKKEIERLTGTKQSDAKEDSVLPEKKTTPKLITRL